MPQFKYSFQGAAHIYPVFIQLLASVFVATEMLPKNHPAMRYGSSDVKDYSFRELCGEAWYHLRRKRATPRQWVMYFSVLLMIFCFATAIVGVTSRVFLGIGTAAQAQIFMLPAGGGGTQNTDLQNGMDTMATTLLFDKRMDQAQMGGIGYNDWGLFMLDKIVRESAQTPQTGGRLQNAFTAVILTYNTAITVIAAVMIFWIILSVVVDTAKTGILGGGRHNMVWAPIRIVFALGLMIPLGTAGYSSGQYCVMKLAEWGSNLGTNGWTAYVQAMAGGGNDFLAPVYPKGYASLVGAVGEMRVCQVTYNAYVVKATNPPSPKQLVYARDTWSADGGTLQHALTNNNDAALCGALQISAPAGVAFGGGNWTAGGAEPIMGLPPARNKDFMSGVATDIDDAAVVALTSIYANVVPMGMDTSATANGGYWVPPAWAGGINNPISQMLGNSLTGMMTSFRRAVAQGAIAQLAGPVETNMTTFACAFAAKHVVGGKAVVDNAVDSNGTAALGKICASFGGATDTGCGATALPAPPAPANGKYDPDYRCHQAAIDAFYNDQSLQLQSGALSLLAWFAGGIGSAAIKEMTQYGWASAGAFYNKVTQINASVQALSQPIINYVPGKLASAAGQDCSTAGYASVEDCRPTGINYETSMVLAQYQRWYEEYASSGAGALGGTGVAPMMATASGTGGKTQVAQQADKPLGLLSLGIGLIRGGATAITALLRTSIGLPSSKNGLMVNLVGDVSDNTLPLANLAKTGVMLIVTGSGILLGASILQGAIGLVTVAAGTALANSMIFSFVTATAATLVTSGIMLTFFVPIMPFLRSAFATLTWMVSIFEAVVMIPIAALAHLTTEGEGLAAGARQCWILWLNVLVRPILYVMGFIGAFIVYNAFVCYFTVAFSAAAANSDYNDNPIMAIVALFFNSTVYVGTCYAAANSVFKMVDIIPNALMRWMPGGSVDHSFDDTAQQAQGYAQSAASTLSRGAAAFAQDTGYAIGKSNMADYKSGVSQSTAMSGLMGKIAGAAPTMEKYGNTTPPPNTPKTS